MSRIGKLPIPVPSGVEVKIDGAAVTVKGAKGTLSRVLRDVSIERDGETLLVKATSSDRKGRAYHGLARALLNNMVVGVSQGFERKLQILGTGYRAEAQGKTLVLHVGFSHPVEMTMPDGVSVATDRTVVTLQSNDKELLGGVAAKIRAVRPPEPYKGKGIRYEGEHIEIKAGKAGK